MKLTKRRLSLAGAATAALLIASGTAAQAAPGDVVYNKNNFAAIIGTNACKSVDFQTTNAGGGPNTPVTAITVTATAQSGGCYGRMRLGYLDGNTKAFKVSGREFVTASKGGYLSVGNAYRCWTEYGVQRADKSWYEFRVYPETRRSGCQG